MRWSYTNWIMQQTQRSTEDRLIREANAAQEAAKTLVGTSQDATINDLLARVAGRRNVISGVELVYLDEHGLRKTAHSMTVWSMLRYIASSEVYARPVSLVYNNDHSATNLMWKLVQVKEVVRLIMQAQQEQAEYEGC